MKSTCHLIDFVVAADHEAKINENEKIDKYLDLARELKNLWNTKVMVIQGQLVRLEHFPKA